MKARKWYLALFSILAIGVALPAPTRAQIDGEAIREMLIAGYEAYKEHDLEIVAAIPDSALRWAPTEDVRDFAEQVAHYANNLWLARVTMGQPAQSVGDSASFLNDKAALAEVVGQWYDLVLADIRAISADDFFTEVPFMGGRMMQKWQVYSFGLQHALWTRGQLVPYFRMHGMAPPAFRWY